jgi:signal transduction histidine kinase
MTSAWLPVLIFEGALLASVLGARAVQRSLAAAVERLTLALTRNEARDAALRAELDALGKAVAVRLRRPLIAARGLAQEALDAPGVRDLAESVWALGARLDEVLATAKLPALPEPPPTRTGPGLPTLLAALRGVLVIAGLVYLLVLLRDGIAAARVAGLVACAWMVWSPVEEGRLRASLWPMAVLVLLGCWLTGGVSGPISPLLALVGVFSALVGERGGWALTLLLGLGLVIIEALGAEPVVPGLWLVTLVAFAMAGLGVRAVLDARRVTLAVLVAAERPVDAAHARWVGLEHLLERVAAELTPEAARLRDAANTLSDGAIERVKSRLVGVAARLGRYQELLGEVALVSRPVERSAGSLHDLLARHLEAWVTEASAKGRTVRLLPSAHDSSAPLDARRVEAIVGAAVQNALEAGANVTIEVTATSVTVVDDGPGLSEPIAARLFPAPGGECQFAMGVTGRPTAAGLGLFLAHRLAEQLGARLTLATSPKGVWVELTIAR